MEQENKLAWQALEYEERERTADWFWALGTVVVAGSLASIIWGNYFFGGLLLISGGLLAVFANKKPEMISYELNQFGLKIDHDLYPYDTMKSFYVQTELRPLMFIHSSRIFMPIIEVPIDLEFADEIEQIMEYYKVPEEKMTEHPSQKIMDYLGF